jgi:thiamine monophosphate synthase
MRLEDAQLFLRIDAVGGSPARVDAAARQAIRCGADAILVPGALPETGSVRMGRALTAACREEDALLLLEDGRAVGEWGADGVHISGPEMSVGQARATVGLNRLVGVGVRGLNDAVLALELDIDYLVYFGGIRCPEAFAALKQGAAVPLFAAGCKDLSEARQVVEGGVYRLFVDGSVMPGTDTGAVIAEYSRLLGRCI